MVHPDLPTTCWQHDGMRGLPANGLDASAAPIPGMNRQAAIDFARVGAQRLRAGTVHLHPGARAGAHDHGALEGVIGIIRCHARRRWGEASALNLHFRPVETPLAVSGVDPTHPAPG